MGHDAEPGQLAFLHGAIFEYVVIARAKIEKIEATLRRDPEV